MRALLLALPLSVHQDAMDQLPRWLAILSLTDSACF